MSCDTANLFDQLKLLNDRGADIPGEATVSDLYFCIECINLLSNGQQLCADDDKKFNDLVRRVRFNENNVSYGHGFY